MLSLHKAFEYFLFVILELVFELLLTTIGKNGSFGLATLNRLLDSILSKLVSLDTARLVRLKRKEMFSQKVLSFPANEQQLQSYLSLTTHGYAFYLVTATRFVLLFFRIADPQGVT